MSTDWPQGYGRRVLTSVDSTMAEAARIAPDLAGPEWILALDQTAARGRRGRPWIHPKGNFAATLVLPLAQMSPEVPLRSFVAALALDEALVRLTGQPDAFQLKWPNDVLLHGAKLAGILLETLTGAGAPRAALAIGIGVNLTGAPAPDAVEPNALRPVSLAGALGPTIEPETFLSVLAPAFARYETQLTTYGFAPIREAWLARAARLGEQISVRTGADHLTGIFDTLDEAGHLVLQTETGPRRIPAGDVTF